MKSAVTVNKANRVIAELKAIGSAERAKASSWFFKTAKGQYGYGDAFIGVTVPEQRAIAKKYKDLPLSEIQKLLKSKYHECRLTALIILVKRYEQSDQAKAKEIVHFYLSNTKYINNWDLVDSSAGYILGDYLLNNDRDILYKLAKSDDLWEKRISIIATQAFIAKGQFKDTFKLCEILMDDSHDLIHKATGWMLREVGKRSKAELVRFLDRYAAKMPRTALRYSIEHFSKNERQRYLKMKNKRAK